MTLQRDIGRRDVVLLKKIGEIGQNLDEPLCLSLFLHLFFHLFIPLFTLWFVFQTLTN